MYSQKAFDILNSSINSAIFIDDKAKEFYSGTQVDEQIPEERLSVNLYKTFKENGKSLAVHKFLPSNLEDTQTLDYMFKGRDLIFLDWELAGAAGQEHSLNLLNRALNSPFINFCCIYSNSNNFNEIPISLEAYFSGLSREEFVLIQENYGYIDITEIQNVWHKSEDELKLFFEQNSIDLNTFPIEKLRNKSEYTILRHIYIAILNERFIIPAQPVNEYEVLNTGSDSFIINNTFVLTLKKDFTEDSDITKLLRRISEVIVKNKGSFFQLLGLEMQSVFNSNERFIDDTILKSSTEALFQFRNHINDDKIFATVIKKLLIEQATLKLRTAKLELLKPDFLDFKSQDLESKTPTHDDLFHLNVFYNSVTVKGLHPDSIPNLNFGDVFKGQGKDYYLCITALCDCYYPDKIQSNFYFAKGVEFEDLEMALRLGDTAFLNFLPNGKVVLWGDKEIVKREKIKKIESESEEEFKLRKENEELRFEAQAYKKFLYKPFFIKPKVYNVENNKLVNNKIRIWDITNKLKSGDADQNLNYFDIDYITTLRDDYTQRISNHAFGHPARVGVDFVKI